MLRRTLLLIVMLLMLVATACTSRTAPDENEQSATQDSGVTPSSEDASAQEIKPASLNAREVAAVEGVQTYTKLEDGDALIGAWTSCTLEGELADLGDGRRSPLRRMIANDTHVYVVYENDKNQSWVRAFSIEVNDDTCMAKPWNEFGTNGQLDLGSGVADVTLLNDKLIATGIQTTLYSLKGEKLGTCDALDRFTRVRGHAGKSLGVARKNGLRLFDVRIQDGECTLEPLEKLKGEENLGMHIAPLKDNSAYAVLQAERAPNALAYLKDGAVVWRYFPGDGNQKERISAISQLATLDDDAVVLRSLHKSIDIIGADGARRAKVDFNDIDAIATLTFPDNMVALDDHRVLVALRHHKSGVEVEELSLGLLTFSVKETP